MKESKNIKGKIFFGVVLSCPIIIGLLHFKPLWGLIPAIEVMLFLYFIIFLALIHFYKYYGKTIEKEVENEQ